MARKAADTETETETVTTTTETAKREVVRIGENDILHFGVDKDGTAYSAENSPKKGEGTKERWSKYTDGMTLAEALAAGLTRSNVRKDRRAGFITIEHVAAPEAEASAEVETEAAE